MICGYLDCQQEITDQQYIFKYFPEEKIHKPVHNFHLQINRKDSDNVKPPKPDTPQKIIPVTEEDLS
jgi:predicted nucleic acid binding AN1-type Zn finger protein